MHFNEMSVKSRQLGLTFVAAALGVAVVLIGDTKDFSLDLMVAGFEFHIHVSVLLTIGALLAIIAVRKLDLGVYHRMLRGAVSFGEDFEKHYMSEIFSLEKGMTQAISHFSRNSEAKVCLKDDGKYTYCGGGTTTALDKIKSFYNWTCVFLTISAIALFLASNPQFFEQKAAAEQQSENGQ